MILIKLVAKFSELDIMINELKNMKEEYHKNTGRTT